MDRTICGYCHSWLGDDMHAENKRLRHDIERHIAMASELATENERLRDENKAAWDSAEYNARCARKAEAAIERLREYARHDPSCKSWGRIPCPCDCGYDALMADMGEAK